MIEIVQPGILASVQDLGRKGFRNIGVGLSGAMDGLAMRIANIMVANPEDAAGIETTLGGFKLRFHADCRFAVTGATAGVTLDGQSLPGWWVATARAGQILKAKVPRTGMRSYIAFAGGIDVPMLMGSRATDLKGGFGGHEGRALRQGDRLHLLPDSGRSLTDLPFGIAARKGELEHNNAVTEVRMIPAAEWGEYSSATQQEFLDADWRLDAASNRVGYRLNGPVLPVGTRRELLSHGILPGTVQLPPSGQPVVQMQDANTCGGYPKLGVVISADLRRLAQTRIGGFVRFRLGRPDEALQAVRAQEVLLADMHGLATLAIMAGHRQRDLHHPAKQMRTHCKTRILSPGTGIFHLLHPDQPEVTPGAAGGNLIEAGQVYGYLESGLLFLPLMLDKPGQVDSVLAREGQMVGYGTPIMSITHN